MAVRREQFTTNLKGSIGVVNPTGYLEAADQTRRTAEAWGVATEKIVQGIDKLSDTIVGYQAEQALNNFKIDTKYTTKTDENGFKYTTVELDIPKIRSFPFNPEVNKQFEQEQFFILKQQIEDLYEFNSKSISQEIINNGGTYEDFELAIEPIERQIREELKDAPSTYGKIIQTLSPIKTKTQLAIQGANNEEVLESLKTRAELEINRINTGAESAFLAGQSLQPFIDESKTIPQRYNIAAVREKQAVLTTKIEGLQAIQKAFPKALAPADIDDTTAVGLQRVQSNNAALGILATGSVNQVILILPDGKKRKVTKQEWLNITKGMDSNTLATVLDTFNTNNNIFKSMFDDEIGLTSMDELAQIANNNGKFSVQQANDLKKIYKKDALLDEWVNSRTPGAKFTTDPQDKANYVYTIQALDNVPLNEDLEDRIYTSVKEIAYNPQLANQIIPEIAFKTLSNGEKVRNEQSLFGVYGELDGEGRKASLLMNAMIEEYFTKGGIQSDFPQYADELLNITPDLSIVNLKNTPGVDYTRDFVKATQDFLEKRYGEKADSFIVNEKIKRFASTHTMRDYKKAKYKKWLEKQESQLTGYYGASEIQVGIQTSMMSMESGQEYNVLYPISKDVYGKELYNAMYETINNYIIDNADTKEFAGLDDTQIKRMKLGKTVFLKGIHRRAYTNNFNKIAFLVYTEDGRAVLNKNKDHMVIYPFQLTTQNIEDQSMKESTYKKLRDKGIDADEARRRIQQALGNIVQ